MAKGSPLVVLRLSPALLSALKEEVRAANETREGDLWTVSSWCRQAVSDKLRHADRSRRDKRHAASPLDPTLPTSGRRGT
jgi:hypothetical protein